MSKRIKWMLVFLTGALVLVLTSFREPTEKYFEIARNLDIFATLFKEVNANYVDEVSPSKMVKTGIDAMLESLDPYTNYIPEDDIEDYRTMTTGQYGGIGAVIGKRNGKNLVLMPYEGFPAHQAGLKIGDEIVSIDDQDVRNKNTNDISKLLKGQAGTRVKITYLRYGIKEPVSLELTRQKIKIENIPYTGMVDQETGYLHLVDFTANAGKDVRNSVEKLKSMGAKQIIFDLRDNPGGLLNEAINICNLFIPKDKEVVSTKGKVTEWNKTYLSLDAPLDTEIPLVVLTSDKSASASEIVSGVIQDYDRGILIGEKTYGKGLVQTTRPLSYNAQLKVTTAKYYIPSGRCIQAIDYSKRKENGDAIRIADSLRVAFKTKNGRTVYDGAGISPDITVEKHEMAQITQSLINKGLLFDYATVYYHTHPTIPAAKEFRLSDKDYNDFITFLKDKDYDYKTRVETELENLIQTAKKEKYLDDIQTQVESLKARISHNKENDLVKFRSEITEALEDEIVSRYYLQKGIIEASFDHDPDIQEALKLFKDKARYQSILTASNQGKK